jgi:hypothetical protein
VQLLDSREEFAKTTEASVLFQGNGELQGRFAILPKGRSKVAAVVPGASASGGGGGGGSSGGISGGGVAVAPPDDEDDCRFLCHASDPRWKWSRIMPRC